MPDEQIDLVKEARELSKRCSQCGELRPLVHFYNDKRAKDGKRAACKDCQNQTIKAWKHSHPEEIKAAARRTRQRSIEQQRSIKRASKKRHWESYIEYQRRARRSRPEKLRAYNLVQRAVRAGKLKRPSTCQNCSAIVRVHAHHEDYGKPLEVIWLCQQCHKLAHHFPNELRKDIQRGLSHAN